MTAGKKSYLIQRIQWTNNTQKKFSQTPNSIRRRKSSHYIDTNGEEGSETMFLNAADGGKYELLYFERLDGEFTKVPKFYKSKVEVLKEAAVLNKQMEVLIAFRIKVENPKGWVNILEETTHAALDVAASRAAISASTPSAARASRRTKMDVIDEESTSNQGKSSVSSDDKDVIWTKPEGLISSTVTEVCLKFQNNH